MSEGIEKQLHDVVKAFAQYSKTASNAPECWVKWFACVGHFNDGKYLETIHSATDLLREHCLVKWFPVFQLLLISLHYVEVDGSKYWEEILVNAAPLTNWQQILSELILEKTNLQSVITTAKSDDNLSQAYYYGGENYLRTGVIGKARDAFENCVAIEAEHVEHRLAKNKLKTITDQVQKSQQDVTLSLVTYHQHVPVATTKDELEMWLRRGAGEKLLAAIAQLIGGDAPQEIVLLADEHRQNSWHLFVDKMLDLREKKQLFVGDEDYQWQSREVRNLIADAYKDIFLGNIRSVNLVQNNSFLGKFKLIKGSNLLTYSKLPSYRTVQKLLESYSDIPHEQNKYFVSHRWLSTEQPDPDGHQLRLLKQNIELDSYYWIDYSCVPQHPRSSQEEKLFRESIEWLPSLLFGMNVIVLRFQDDGYYERAWCFFELLAANVLGREVFYLTEKDIDDTTNSGRDVLEQTLLRMDLPDYLAANPDDLGTLQKIVQSVAFFFKLRVVEHYMFLGQLLSDQNLFFLEDPYYFMAICDFSSVMLWLFDKAKELGISLLDLTRDYHDENIFVRIAQLEEFQPVAGEYYLPKKVALDEVRLAWFQANLKQNSSELNLFYKISSMIE